MKKSRILAILCVISMVISMVVVPAYAAGEYTISLVTADGATSAVRETAAGSVDLYLHVENTPAFASVGSIGARITMPEGWALSAVTTIDDNCKLGTFENASNTDVLEGNVAEVQFILNSAVAAGASGNVAKLTFSVPEGTEGQVWKLPLDVTANPDLNRNTSADISEGGTTLSESMLTVPFTMSVAFKGKCRHCGEIKAWELWTEDTIPADGKHYYLAEDVTDFAFVTNGDMDVCLDLRGHTATAVNKSYSVDIKGGTRLNIMDNTNTGAALVGKGTVPANGGVVRVQGSGTVLNTYNITIRDGHVDTGRNGGNLFVTGGTANLYNTKVLNGKNDTTNADTGGGNIAVTWGGKLNINENSVISGGQAAGAGGNIFAHGDVSKPAISIEKSTVTGGKAEKGGNIYGIAQLTADNVTIAGGTATQGGNIYNVYHSTGWMELNNSTVTGGTATGTEDSEGEVIGGLGGNIYNAGTLTVTDTQITDGLATSLGGNIYNPQGTLNLKGETTLSGGMVKQGDTVMYNGFNLQTEGGEVNIYHGVKIITAEALAENKNRIRDVNMVRFVAEDKTVTGATLNMYGGKIDNLNIPASSTLNMYAGYVGTLTKNANGTANVHNGQFGASAQSAVTQSCTAAVWNEAGTSLSHGEGTCATCTHTYTPVELLSDCATCSTEHPICYHSSFANGACTFCGQFGPLKVATCPTCKEEKRWEAWNYEEDPVNGGHYYLSASQINFGLAAADITVCLDMNGKTAENVDRAIAVSGTGVLNIFDLTKSGDSEISYAGTAALGFDGGLISVTEGGTLNMSDVTVRGGMVANGKYGGNILVSASTANLNHVSVLDGQAGTTAVSYGGNIAATYGGTVNITNGSTVSGGKTVGGNGLGGNIYTNGTDTKLNITDSTVSNGGFTTTVNEDGTTTDTATTYNGGNLYITSGTVTVTNSAIYNGMASTQGGNIYQAAGTLSLKNGTTVKNGTVPYNGCNLSQYSGTLNIYEGVEFSNNKAAGTTQATRDVYIRGTVNMYGGHIPNFYNANANGALNMYGGYIGAITMASAATVTSMAVYNGQFGADVSAKITPSCTEAPINTAGTAVVHKAGECAVCTHSYTEKDEVVNFVPYTETHHVRCHHNVVDAICTFCNKGGTATPDEGDGETETGIKCTHCGTVPTAWTAWDGTVATSGHYYLADDMSVSAKWMNNAVTICLDLRGHTITAGTRAFNVNNASAVLSIMDTTKFGGAIVGSESTVEADGGVFNAAKGVLNIYDITVSGGKVTPTGKVGANVFVNANGTFNAKNCVITGGNAYRGGNIYSNGTVTLVDTIVSNGVANNNSGGANIYIHTGTLNLKGATTLSGGKNSSSYSTYPAGTNIYAAGGTVNIYEGVKVETSADVVSSRQRYDIHTAGTAAINLYGGEVDNLNINTNAVLNMYGGKVGKLYNLGTTTVYNGQLACETVMSGNTITSKTVTAGTCTTVVTDQAHYHHPATDTACETCGRIYVKAIDDTFNAGTQSVIAHRYTDGTCDVGDCAYNHHTGVACTCHPGEEINWTPWDGTTALAAGGHYFLENDITAAEMTSFLTDNLSDEICLDMTGFDIYAADGKMAIKVQENTLNIMDTTKKGESEIIGSDTAVADNGMIYVTTDGVLNLHDVTVRDGKTKNNDYHGGNISVGGNGKLNLYNTKVLDGQVNVGTKTESDGGNIAVTSTGVLNIYEGTVISGGNTGSTSTSYGGNIYINTGSSLNIYGGTVTGGTTPDGYGNDIYMNASDKGSTTTLKIYGGEVGDLFTRNESNRTVYFYMFGGSVKSFKTGGELGKLEIYNGELGFDPETAGWNGASILGTCAYVIKRGDVYTVWHKETAAPCANCSDVATGVTYKNVGLKEVIAVVDGVAYGDKSYAFAGNAIAGDAIIYTDIALANLDIQAGATLELNGYDLTIAGTLDCATEKGQIIDSVGTSKIYGDVMFAKTNAQLPVSVDENKDDVKDYIIMEEPTLTQDTYPAANLPEGVHGHYFYISDYAADTMINEAMAISGDDKVALIVRVTGEIPATEEGGTATAFSQEYTVSPAALKMYLASWDTYMLLFKMTGWDTLVEPNIQIVIASHGVEYAG